jgi:3-dehydroquinate dehydratase II
MPHARRHILVLNGPNLNLLGTREPEIYGTTTLADIEHLCAQRAAQHGFTVECRQSNHEGELVDWVQSARGNAAAVIINPGAYTHTSIALRDAISAIAPIPVVEVHLSNIHAREPFRQHSYVSGVAKAVLCGTGAVGYGLAIEAVTGLFVP